MTRKPVNNFAVGVNVFVLVAIVAAILVVVWA